MSNENYYFDQEVEDAIVEYNNTEDQTKRSILYRNKIHDAFKKIAENIINTFNYSYFDVPQEDVEDRLVSHLVEKIGKYKPEKAKAFSYFSKIAKNYCIRHNKSNYKKYKQELRIDDEDLDFDIEDDYDVREDIQQQEFFEKLIDYWEDNITNMFSKERDLKIADAVLELFKVRKNIETFNKKALYIMIREMTDIQRTQHITKVVGKFKEEFAELSKRYHSGKPLDKKDEYKSKFFTDS